VYLLDTDTVIYVLKGAPAVEDNLRRHYHDPIRISVITLMELYYGAYKSQKVTSNLAKIRTLEHSLEVLPLDQEIVEVFGRQKVQLEKLGTPLDDFDLILGCTALAHHLILVTNNVKHFRKIDSLKLTNWVQKAG
jgi:tRNA(fMet)-specific endonuclease VapC